jgi:hypothetical protein
MKGGGFYNPAHFFTEPIGRKKAVIIIACCTISGSGVVLRWAFEFSFSKGGMPGKNGEEGTRNAIQKKTRQKKKLEKSEKPPGS